MMDLRLAIRSLIRRPLFTAVAALTIGLGIASATTVFSVVDSVLLEPLPYTEPGRLVSIWEDNQPRERDRNVVSPANFMVWKEQGELFQDVAALIETSETLTGDGPPERIGALYANAEIFPLLGARAQLGRLFTAEEDVDGGPTVVVLSDGFWRRHFGGDASVIGRTITIDGRPREVIGVLARGFDFESAAQFGGTGARDAWLPMQFPPEARQAGGRYLQVLGRLAPSVTLEAAQARMDALATALQVQYPDRQAGWGINVVPLQEQVIGDARRPLWIVFGAVAFVLLIACANVANLLLARATDREQEMAVRAALGAGRLRVARQLMTESLALALAGGLLGVLLSLWAVRVLVALGPEIPRLETIGVDGRVLLFAIAATLATGALFGLAPVLRLSRPDLRSWLSERLGSSRQEGRKARSVLVVAEVALSLVLLVGAGLMVRSFARLLDTGVGFDTQNLLVAQVEASGDRYGEPGQRARFMQALVERASRLPGVQVAGAITFPPLSGAGSATSFWANDRPVPAAGQHPVADVRPVQQDYFRTLGIGVLQGRTFDERDRAGAAMTIVISRATAEELWPGADPIGRSISMPWGDTLVAEIIGVVEDIRHVGPNTEPRSMLYWDHRQFADFSSMSVVLRTTGDPLAAAPLLRAELGQLDALLPLYNVRTMESYLADSVARTRFAMLALTGFAVVALLLAAIGIYGVMAYAVGQRAREIGVRLALGARGGDVVWMVLRQGIGLVVVALAAGLAGALALARLLDNMVYGITTTDGPTLLAVSLILASAALLACWLPARRASRIDPVEAMRSE